MAAGRGPVAVLQWEFADMTSTSLRAWRAATVAAYYRQGFFHF